ncbi:MAG: cytochrome c [Bacteroidia bacterium]|nr:cytochrome c [Bacteroidia bacterium]
MKRTLSWIRQKFTTNKADLGKDKIFYNALPVEGTVAVDEMPGYPYKNDSLGYVLSANVINPLPALNADDIKEAERLYLVNCGICHGTKLDGNGPLWKDGDGPYSAAPRNLLTDPITANMADGTMFHSITYGRNMMGSYASQLSSKQRWMVIHYIKSKKDGGTAKADTAGTK